MTKQAAKPLGPAMQAVAASDIMIACQTLGDPAVVRDELIPWAEEALAGAGSEEWWNRALPALLWAYEYVGEPQKVIERGQYWLDQAKARNVLTEPLASRTKGEMALAQVTAGHYQEAKAALHEAIQDGPQWLAESIYGALAEAKQAHPEVGEIEALPPRFRGCGGPSELVRVVAGEKAGIGLPVYGNAAFEITGATCDLPFVEVTLGERKLEHGQAIYQLQITATGPADKLGMHQATVTLTTNAPNQPEVKVPVMVQVTVQPMKP